jgi:RNA polymerase sigma-54 factor
VKTSLQFKLSQQLALTPQLQQSIRLLQLSTLELNQELEQLLADNPLLERLDDPLQDCARIEPNGSIVRETSSAASSDSGEPAPDFTDNEGADGSDQPMAASLDQSSERADDERNVDWSQDFDSRTPSDDNDEERTFSQVSDGERSLREHLMEQLTATRAQPLDRALVELLIDNLNDDGFLDASLEEIGDLIPEELDVDPETISAALKLLQSFEPAGVGARDLRESLLLQIDSRVHSGEAGTSNAWGLARAIVDEHLSLLAAKDYTRLRKLLHCNDDLLREAQALIRSLTPRPGAAYSIAQANYILPDVVVRKTRDGWRAEPNPQAQPRLRVNDLYARILRGNRVAGSSNLSAQLQEARWLVKNIQQRGETILRVAQAIVQRQKGFFSHGAVAMRPLVLREIAEELGMHESTISRVTTNKYMLTHFGIFELKYFFGSHIATDSGGAASSTAIRELIRQLIDAENPKAPLADGRIAELLGEQGFVVARRTVAKYREAIRIPTAAHRKVL